MTKFICSPPLCIFSLLLITTSILGMENNPQALKTFSLNNITFVQSKEASITYENSDTFHDSRRELFIVDNKDRIWIETCYGVPFICNQAIKYDKATKKIALISTFGTFEPPYEDQVLALYKDLRSMLEAYKKLNNIE